MKRKLDFITNSSSSSFIVVFPKEIKTYDEVNPYMENWKAQIVLQEAIKQTPIQIKIGKNPQELKIPIFDKVYAVLLDHFDDSYINIAEIVTEITDAIEKECPELMVPMTDIDYLVSKIKRAREKDNPYEALDISKKEIEELVKKCGGKGFVYHFEYCDNEGESQSEMEHGGTFDKLPHIRISHH